MFHPNQNTLQAEGVFLMQTEKRAVLFVNGQAKPGFEVALLPGDFLIAVDGGLRHLTRLGLKPHLLIGDLDSVSPQELAEVMNAGVEVRRFPPAKDQTDLELALEYALTNGYAQIMIAYALGERSDHTLGNINLLSRPNLVDKSAWLDDGQEEIHLVSQAATLPTRPGDLVSLLAWGSPAEGVTTQGLRYPLRNEPLFPWQSRGISNVALSDRFELKLSSGRLLVMITRH